MTGPKTLALIHTSPMLVPMFNSLAEQHLDGVQVFHMVDESLIQETMRAGRLQKQTVRRLIHHVESACGAGADAVLVTCSSIGRGVPVARTLFDIPILRIDEAMAERAVGLGSRIGVLATVATTLEPTIELLRETAANLGRDVSIESSLCKGAFEAVLKGDTQTHDKIVTEGLLKLAASVDVIVLAQASMARVAELIPKEATQTPILASPPLAMAQARQTIGL